LKKLAGNTEIEDSLRKLDKLTQEEARMAAAEHMRITRSVEEGVQDVRCEVEGVGEMVRDVDERVQSVGERVQDKVQHVGDIVQDVNHKLDQASRSLSAHYSPFRSLKHLHRKSAPR
jgi:uncharacterized protein YoxC